MKRRVVVTGLGLVTPCGHTVAETWSALMAGRSGVSYIEKFDTARFPVRIAAEVKGFDPLKFIEKKEARKMGAFIQYAIAASIEAIYGSGLVRQTAPQSRCLNVEDKASLDTTLAALSEESQPNERAAGGD